MGIYITVTQEPSSTSPQDARSKISDLGVHTHIADWGASDITGNISSSTLSADNCVSIETTEWESVNPGLSAIITRDMVDADLALDVQDSDIGSRKYQHNDLATGSDAHLASQLQKLMVLFNVDQKMKI